MVSDEFITAKEILEQLEGQFDIRPANDLASFNNKLAYLVRKGEIPPPIRQPRNGKRGTVGLYPLATVWKLREIFSRRQDQGKARESLPKLSGSQDWSQKQYSVSFWLPKSLADRVDAQIQAGYSISQQLLVGFRLLGQVGEGVQRAVIQGLKADHPERPAVRRVSEERWQLACCLVLATHLLEHLRDLAYELGVDHETVLTRCRFDIVVSEGHTRITAVSVQDKDGNWREKVMVKNG